MHLEFRPLAYATTSYPDTDIDIDPRHPAFISLPFHVLFLVGSHMGYELWATDTEASS